MKRFKIFAVLLVLLCGSSLYAKDFEWSECWCNYGGGIEKGDVIVNLDAGFYYSDFTFAAIHSNFWYIPPMMAEVQFAQPIWKLPFTFGGYAGLRAFGYKYIDHYDSNGTAVYETTAYWSTFFGAEAAYHIMLPPDGLDLYAVTRVGGNIPFVRPHSYSLGFADYFHVGEAIGANWFFGKVFGVNLEFGYPFSKAGVTFKF